MRNWKRFVLALLLVFGLTAICEAAQKRCCLLPGWRPGKLLRWTYYRSPPVCKPVEAAASPVICTLGEICTAPAALSVKVRQKTVFDIRIEEMRCLELVNEERLRRKLLPLRHCSGLAEASQSWSETMRRSGFRHGISKEVIARGGQSAEFAYRIWMNSPPHREALLNPNIREIGFGTSGGFWTARFR